RSIREDILSARDVSKEEHLFLSGESENSLCRNCLDVPQKLQNMTWFTGVDCQPLIYKTARLQVRAVREIK
ncbi:hypothetical protein ACQP3F_26440, partial [Escherichia coli]